MLAIANERLTDLQEGVFLISIVGQLQRHQQDLRVYSLLRDRLF